MSLPLGHSLILVARDREKLDLAAKQLVLEYGVQVSICAKDLSEPGAAEQIWAGVRVSTPSTYWSTTPASVSTETFVSSRWMRDTNADAQRRGPHYLDPPRTAGSRRRGRGRILNVASIVGYQPGGPGMAVYYATKAYVLSFTKGLALELAGTGVSVTALCPGVTVSAFEERAEQAKPSLSTCAANEARRVAKAGYRAMMKGTPNGHSGVHREVVRFLLASFRRGSWRCSSIDGC